MAKVWRHDAFRSSSSLMFGMMFGVVNAPFERLRGTNSTSRKWPSPRKELRRRLISQPKSQNTVCAAIYRRTPFDPARRRHGLAAQSFVDVQNSPAAASTVWSCP